MPTVLVVYNQFPKRSETFLFRELVGWRRRGLDVRALSLLPPERGLPDEMRPWAAETLTVAGVLRSPRLLARAIGLAARWPAAVLDSRRGPTRPWTVTAAGLAVGPAVAAAALSVGAFRLHAAWANAAAEAARFAARALGLPYTVSVHAADLWRDTDPAAARLTAAEIVLPCNAAAARALERGCPALASRLRLAPHGLDAAAFPWTARRPGPPWRLLAVGRLVPKKGFDRLVAACARLEEEGLAFTCAIVGEGPERRALARRIRALDLGQRVTLLGARDPAEVARLMAEAHALLVPCVVASDGDRDGVPNALLEGLLTGLPVVATRTGSIDEVVSDGVTGRFSDDDPRELAGAVRALLADYGEALRMGRTGRERVLQRGARHDQGEVLARLFAGTADRAAS